MEYFSASHGILNNRQIPSLFSTNKVRRLSLFNRFSLPKNSTFIGWGYKSNTKKIRDFAAEHSLEYWALEDGFISWLNHPSMSKPSQRLSYIVDKTGIYYDASAPSGLDVCLAAPIDFDRERVQRLQAQLIKLKISKYNQSRCEFPEWLLSLSAKTDLKPILLVDQTFGDASIEFSGGSQDSFQQMLAWGLDKLKQNPKTCLIAKVHPDVILGTKKGYLHPLMLPLLNGEFKNRIHFLTEDVSPTQLMSMCSEVATVSSQLGFEGLWQNKQVTCFAWPFYAGRGLTQDLAQQPLPYKREESSLSQLIHAALIQYPVYLHPDTQKICQVEAIIDYLQSHFISRDRVCNQLIVPNISLWKRSFIPSFIADSAQSIRFTNKKAPSNFLQKNHQKLIWGMKSPLESVWRIEDGFIRSVGLGADLRRPSSLVLDDLGIYYNGKQASRLEVLLNDYQLNEYEIERSKTLVDTVVKAAVTKYNVDKHADINWVVEGALDKDVILVTGQFQQDLSMIFGANDISDNLSLLKQVRLDFPDAHIIYKEHPDVYSGVRPGKIAEADVLAFANVYVTDVSITDLFDVVDRVCTICSLSGFEALMRNISVTTYGLPFYAGWGLTDDRCCFSRRNKKISLESLCYITLVIYARYVNWNTRQLTTVESAIESLIYERGDGLELKSSWHDRQYRKIKYLVQALFKRSVING